MPCNKTAIRFLFSKIIGSDQDTPPHKRTLSLPSPLTGKVKPLAELAVKHWSLALLGDGVAIEASHYQLLAPVDCSVLLVDPLCWQLRLQTREGLKLAIQLGASDNKQALRGFRCQVKAGQRIAAGQVLAHFDPRQLKLLDCPLCPVTLLNSDKVQGIRAPLKQVRAGQDELLQIFV